jgi:methylated-DNA-protein-cysteine methyltransferase-like protein
MAQKKERSFFQDVYKVVFRIPAGKVVSYGQIAAFLGKPRSGRTVGWAMHGSPQGIPWFRVIKKSGELPFEGITFDSTNQRELLSKEGITFLENGRVDIKQHMWQIDLLM